MQKSASVLRKWIESQDPFRLYPSAFNPKDYRIPMETGVSRKIIFRVWASGTTALNTRLIINPLSAKPGFSALVPQWPTFESDLFFFLIWGKIAVEVLSQHRNNNENCLTWRKTVQCLCPVNQIGALKFVMPRWSTPEMSRMTAVLRFPRAADWPSCSCTSMSFFFFNFCRTWTKRYLITSQTRVKRVSRIHHRTILGGWSGGVSG